MPGGFPDFLEICNPQTYTPATSAGVTITSGTANTKGSYTTLIAALACDACWIGVEIQSNTGTAVVLTDIAIGPAGSERVILSNLITMVGWGGNVSPGYCLPIHIPRGTRISARCQSGNAAITAQVAVRPYDGSFMTSEGVAGVDSIGVLTASSRGTAVASSATTNTKGSYTSLGITTRDYIGLIIAMDNVVDPSASCYVLGDIALGAGGAQQAIIPNISLGYTSSSGGMTPHTIGPLFIPIPAGTNLWARHSVNITAAQSLDWCAYGMYK